MTLMQLASRCLAMILSALLCSLPPYVAAQTSAAAPQSTQTARSQDSQNQVSAPATEPKAEASSDAQTGSTRVDPARAPLAPVPSARPAETSVVPPDAPSEVQRSQQAQSPSTSTEARPAASSQRVNPLGTATAQQGATSGGVASRPAGEAIAPAKQRQVHSLLIKLGLVAAGAAAVGTVVGLTRGTSNVPPGAR